MPESDNEDQHIQDTASVTQAESVDDNSSKEQRTHPLLATSKVMGIMLGGFDGMGEGDSKKMLEKILRDPQTFVVFVLCYTRRRCSQIKS